MDTLVQFICIRCVGYYGIHFFSHLNRSSLCSSCIFTLVMEWYNFGKKIAISAACTVVWCWIMIIIMRMIRSYSVPDTEAKSFLSEVDNIPHRASIFRGPIEWQRDTIFSMTVWTPGSQPNHEYAELFEMFMFMGLCQRLIRKYTGSGFLRLSRPFIGQRKRSMPRRIEVIISAVGRSTKFLQHVHVCSYRDDSHNDHAGEWGQS